MRITRVITALVFGLLLHTSFVFSAPLPRGLLPDGYENWESRILPCRINDRVTVELRTYTHRGIERIIRSASVWYVNGNPFEVIYFEPKADSASLSRFRATGFSAVLYHDGNWIKFGGEHTMTDMERIASRIIRNARLKDYGVTPEKFKKSLAACNKDRPGQLR